MWNDRLLAPCSLWGRAAFKNLFGGAPATPAVAPPPAMPDPLDPANIAASQKAQQALSANGRSSTVLTTRASRTPSTTIAGGAGAYTNSKLSGAA